MTAYSVEQVPDLLWATEYMGYSDPGELQKVGVLVIRFILVALGGLTEPECHLNYANVINPQGPYLFTSNWSVEEIEALDWVADHYCITREQAQLFGATLLTFFAGLDAASNGTTVTKSGTDQLLSAPSGLTANARSNSAVLSWSAPASDGGSAVTDYAVQFSTDGLNWTTFSDGVSTATSTTVDGLSNGVNYVFRVVAENATGIRTVSNTAPATPFLTVPGEATGLAGSASDSAVLLSWSPPGADGGAELTYTVSYARTGQMATRRMPMIVGGNSAEIASYPYQVALLLADTSDSYWAWFCGGTLVAPQWVVTAAHCTYGDTSSEIEVGVGKTNLSEMRASDRYSVAAIYQHPSYDDVLLSNDIALLQLSNPVPASAGLWIPWLDDATQPVSGSPIEVSGWGTMGTADEGPYPDDLHAVTVSVIGNPGDNTCGNWPNFDSSEGLCTGGTASVGTCQGDSGGPNVIQVGGVKYLAGVTSYTSVNGCATGDLPNVATRVSTYADWILSYIGSAWTDITGISGTSYQFEGLTNGAPYTFRVAATNAAGTSNYTTAISVVPLGAPRQPTGLIAIADGNVVELSWSAPTDNGGTPITDYTIEYSADSGTTWSVYTDGASVEPHATVTGLVLGTSYTFRVTPLNAVGSGDASDTATATPFTPPGQPTGLTATPGSGQVALSWVAPTETGGGEITYTVEYGELGQSATRRMPMIVGGDTAEIASYQYQVALLRADTSDSYLAQFCGGTLVASQWVVTAAWCTYGDTSSEIEVGVGKTNLSDMGSSDRYSVAAIYEHPSYDDDLRLNDIALLQLSNPVPASAGSSIAWLDDATQPVSGTSGQVSGWGVTTSSSPYGFTDELRSANVNVLASPGDDTCGDWLYFDSERELCVGGQDDVGTCALDTGGPLVVEINGTKLLAGVTAYGCASETLPNVLARVSTYADWIRTYAGSPWTEITDIATTSHIVTGLTNSTPYVFKVTARNLAGSGTPSATAVATPANLPGQPTGLTATPGNTQVALAWTAPTDTGGSVITDYTVGYSTDGSTWTTFADGTSTAGSATVTGLANGTSYTFRISAVSAVGTGSASTTTTATPATVPGQATGLTATPGNAQVALVWVTPTDIGSSPITDYTVEYSTDGSTWSTFADGTSTTLSATVTGLANGTNYTFRISATSAVGAGNFSDTVSATPVTVPGQATGLTATPGNTQVALVWTAPTDTGGSAITDYTVKYSTDGSTWSTFADGTSTTLSATVTGLTNGTNYTFRISAVNAVGNGTASTTTTATPVTVPGQATGLTATPGNTQVALVWIAPTDIGSSPITDYTVEYSTDGLTWLTFADGTSTTLSATVTGLTNGTNYVFRVSAVNAVGSGPASTTAMTNLATAPGQPTGLTATPGNTQVALAWTAPTDTGGSAITDYTVEYSTDGSTWSTFADGTSTAASATVTGLANDTTYVFRVSAVNDEDSSAPSGTATATPVAPTPTINVLTPWVGSFGNETSVAIGDDGNPVIAYENGTAQTLNLAVCLDPVCENSTHREIGILEGGGPDPSVAIGDDGNPVISYTQGNQTSGLRVAACADPSCASSTTTTIDEIGSPGRGTSIAIGTDGNPVISYMDADCCTPTTRHLRVAKCSNPTCTSSTTVSVDSISDRVGKYSSLAIGTDGNPVISYLDITNETLKVAVCGDPACTSATLRTLGVVGHNTHDFDQTSIVIVDGKPVISYFLSTAPSGADGTLNVAACSDASCSSATITALDSYGTNSAITLDANGLPAIAYFDRNYGVNDLKLARCSDWACTDFELSVVDSEGFVGGGVNSIATLPDGRLVISYFDQDNYMSEVDDQHSQPVKVAVVPATTTTPDNTAPTLTEKWPYPGCGNDGGAGGCYPSNGGTSRNLLHCSNVLKLVFSEPVFSAAPGEWTWDPGLNPAYGLIQIYNVSVSGSFAQWNDAGGDSITVSGLGSNTLYLVLDEGMCVSSNPREWGARIAPNALQDAAGNTFSGITGYYDWDWAVVSPPSNPSGQYSYPPGYSSP